MIDAYAEYKHRFERHTHQLSITNKQIRSLGNLRLLVVVAFAAVAVVFFRSHNHPLALLDILTGCTVFALLVLWHNDLYRKRAMVEKGITINEQGMKRIKGEWHDFKDCGDDFIEREHPYSLDLDLFGKHSVFQWICACHTFRGRLTLAKALNTQEKDVPVILARQTAIEELSGLLDWRQRFKQEGLNDATGKDPTRFLQWMGNGAFTFTRNGSMIFFKILPWISLTVGVAGFFLTKTLLFFALIYSIQLALFALFYSKTAATIRAFEKNGTLLLAYSSLIESIEKQPFSAPYLNKLKGVFTLKPSANASIVLRKFAKVLNATEIRSNPIAHLLANALWLWDIQCILKAEALKRNHSDDFNKWLEAIGEFETLASFSIIRFEHPDWVFPTLTSDCLAIETTRMGHPLLHDNDRIDNDFSLTGGGKTAIITGSNMSGKSTFLRTVGVNLVLAYTGAPVCAATFSCAPSSLYSSMRINDDLSSKTSTFYAELLRIKKIITAVKNDETVVFLLDELFRGTNSQDRHDGAVAVLYSLINQKSIGIISTHDSELCSLATSDPEKFVNFHFDEHYNESGISFDYKLKPGPSTTRNAMFLMRMVGIQ